MLILKLQFLSTIQGTHLKTIQWLAALSWEIHQARSPGFGMAWTSASP